MSYTHLTRLTLAGVLMVGCVLVAVPPPGVNLQLRQEKLIQLQPESNSRSSNSTLGSWPMRCVLAITAISSQNAECILLQLVSTGPGMHRVVVTLKDLKAGAEWAERIARARDRVMSALKNHRVEVNRVYDVVPALALTVDDGALRVLRFHPDVSTVVEEGTLTPGNGAVDQRSK